MTISLAGSVKDSGTRMLKRIKLQGYKSLVDVEVELQPLTVLFGPNGAGKSNFLDALQLLSRLATRPTVREAFEPPYRGVPLESFTLGPHGLRGLIEQESALLSLAIDVALSTATVQSLNQSQDALISRTISGERSATSIKDWQVYQSDFAYKEGEIVHYEVTLEVTPKSGLVRIKSESISRSGMTMKVGAESATSQSSGTRDYWLHSDFRALQEELSQWSFYYFEPRERMRESTAVRETRHVGMMGENLASFLNTLKATDPARFKATERSLRSLVPSLSKIDVGVTNRGEVELRLIENGVPIPASLLSEGTLRLLGLLALGGASDTPTLVGFEEPENGVHPRRIQLIAELLKSYVASGETQMIVTTHSPVLLDALPPESLYVCRKEEGATTITLLGDLDPLGLDTRIAAGLNGVGEELTVSERVLRGDFDA